MTIYLIRHGETAYNADFRYQGQRDIPLSPAGEAALTRADFTPETVFVSNLQRTHQTARRLFPEAKQIVVPELAEMDLGAFEGRSYRDMEDDAAYRAWVDGGCVGKCPGGESRAEFSERVCAAFAALVDERCAGGMPPLVIVAHGGVQMAVMERFALPEGDYFSWKGKCGGGYVLAWEEALWKNEKKLRLERRVQYTKDAMEC